MSCSLRSKVTHIRWSTADVNVYSTFHQFMELFLCTLKGYKVNQCPLLLFGGGVTLMSHLFTSFFLSESSGLPAVTMETEASHMLEAALDQMDDIIAGTSDVIKDGGKILAFYCRDNRRVVAAPAIQQEGQLFNSRL